MSKLSLEPLTIAVVDDDEVYRRYAAAVLSTRGSFVIYEAASGAELRALLSKRVIDCIVLDFNFGSETGFSITEQLNLHFPVVPPTVMLTADSSAHTVIKALRLGISDYLPKRGLKPEELASAIVRAVERSRQDQALKSLVGIDDLTGLPNRRTFNHTLHQEVRRAQRTCQSISLLMVDVDQFKDLNDALGHLRGDDCLRQLGQIFRGEVRRPGDLFARYGGEEFGVILPDTPIRGAVVVAERLVKAIENREIPHPSSPSGRVTISVGAASIPALDIKSAEMLISIADSALYRAKREGRNRVIAHLDPVTEAAVAGVAEVRSGTGVHPGDSCPPEGPISIMRSGRTLR